eukprot:Selendium_serpulae@DN5006_c0_g1_i2.p2
MGSGTSAAAHYSRVLELDSGNAEARRRLDALRRGANPLLSRQNVGAQIETPGAAANKRELLLDWEDEKCRLRSLASPSPDRSRSTRRARHSKPRKRDRRRRDCLTDESDTSPASPTRDDRRNTKARRERKGSRETSDSGKGGADGKH